MHVPIMSQPVLWVIKSNSFVGIQLLGQRIVLYEILFSDKLFPFPIEFSCKFLLILFREGFLIFQIFNKIISFGIFSHSYLVFTTMPRFWMAAKYVHGRVFTFNSDNLLTLYYFCLFT